MTPTRKESFWREVSARKPTLLFVEHDARFRETIATKTIQL